MIISTNIKPADFEAVYTERIFSRLMGNFIALEFIGQDIRLIKKYKKKRTV
jgi:DNA replication protein DnaC